MLKLPERKTTPGAPAGKPAGWWRALWRFCLRAGLALLVVFLLYAAYLDAVVVRTFENHRWTLPARVYARPLDVYAGQALTAATLLGELRDLGYRQVGEPARPGEYAVSGNGMTVRLATRGFVFPDGATVSQLATVGFSAVRVEKLVARDKVLRLEPTEIGTLRAQAAEDRVLMRLADRPPYLVEALMAVEDRDFPGHFGVSPRALARALYVNVMAGEVQQGGSTLTQQLVKNFYLDSERTLSRKLNEAIMSVLLELHYDKATILETYCNEIYLGQLGQRAVHGFALASQFYFGRPVGELQLHEVALLVALVKGPSQYNPWKHPQRALERRNLVLRALVDTGVIDEQRMLAARKRPLGMLLQPNLRVNRFPSFMTLLRRELQAALSTEQLVADGLTVFTSLDPGAQAAAEAAVVGSLARIEQDKGVKGLEAALVVADPRSGAIQAAVGGRDVDYAGFDRVSDARRSIGSLMKPVVLLAALRQPQKFSLASTVSDAPLEVAQQGGKTWRPLNYDGVSHGEAPDHQVMLIDTLAHSWNLATVRLGLDLGVPSVLAQARVLGVQAELPRYPSVLLGSGTLSPLEVLAMYQPLAADGVRVRPWALSGVLGADQRPLYRRAPDGQRAVDAATVFVLNHALQETFRSGTAASAYQTLSPAVNAAGKTGTTDNGRDSWFAGYTGSHVAVAWVGYDDYRPSPLSGASGALKVWTGFMASRPQVPLPVEAPEGVEWAWLVPGGKSVAAEGCGGAVRLPVIAGTVPTEQTLCGQAVEAVQGVKGFFRRLFD